MPACEGGVSKFKTLDEWEREQIDAYIREGGHITVITPRVFGDAIEEKSEARRKQASARTTEMHRKRRMRLGDGYKRQEALKDMVFK